MSKDRFTSTLFGFPADARVFVPGVGMASVREIDAATQAAARFRLPDGSDSAAGVDAATTVLAPGFAGMSAGTREMLRGESATVLDWARAQHSAAGAVDTAESPAREAVVARAADSAGTNAATAPAASRPAEVGSPAGLGRVEPGPGLHPRPPLPARGRAVRDCDSAPSIAEVAALTRRLRELSGQGRDVDPAARAAFLADKEALLARIADTQHDPRDPATDNNPWADSPWIDGAGADGAGDASGPGGAGDRVAPQADELDRAFDELTDRNPLPGDPGGQDLQIGPHGPYLIEPEPVPEPEPVDGSAAEQSTGEQTTGGPEALADAAVQRRLAMPEWMWEHAAATQAQMAVGTDQPPGPDELGTLAERISALRQHIAATDNGTDDTADHEDRGGQLPSWHTEDRAGADGSGADGSGDGEGCCR